MDWNDLNKALRSELSAVETYQQALEKEQGAEQEQAFQQLSNFLRDHREAASQLESQIQRLGGTPSRDSGAWGTWSKIVMGAAKLFGDKAALKALKEGEESGVKEYQELLQDPTTPNDVKTVLNNICSKEQTHIQQLDRLMQTA